MSDSNKSQDTALPATRAELLRLKVRNCGNVGAFKNRKRMTKNAVLITDPKNKARMTAIQHVLESELLSASAIDESVISMAALRQFLMRSCPRDDRWTNIPEIILTGELVTDGSEGADITIERLP